MKLSANSTKTFIETLERQAIRRELVIENGQPVVGSNGQPKTRIVTLDKDLKNVYDLYKQGKIKFQDHVIEVTAIVSGATSVDFLKTSDNIEIGVRNIAQAKLTENEFFCPVAISMLGATVTADTDAAIQDAEFSTIDTLNAVTNAQIDLKINTTEYLLRELPTSRFVGLNGQGSQDAPKGCVFLDNTSIMKPQQRNELTLKSGVAMPASTAVRFLLHGTRTTPVGK